MLGDLESATERGVRLLAGSLTEAAHVFGEMFGNPSC